MNRFIFHAVACIIIFTISSFNSFAASDIRFSSYRFALDPKNRQQSFTLTNRGPLASRCILGFSHNKVLSNGDLVSVETAAQVDNSASPLVRYSPSRVSIPPNGQQTVRIALKRARNQKDGEYVSYLRFSCMDDARMTKGEIGLAPRINYNIPIVVRIGKLTAQGEIAQIKLQQQALTFNITRQGDRSLNGNIKVIDSASGDTIGVRNNLSIYLPTTKQQVAIHLSQKPRGNVIIEFKEHQAGKTGVTFKSTHQQTH